MRNELHSAENVRLRTALKRERKKAGLFQSDIAERTHRNQSYISKFENGDVRLDVMDYVKFCEAIGCDPCEILKEVISNETNNI